jgi:hypothetical protein
MASEPEIPNRGYNTSDVAQQPAPKRPGFARRHWGKLTLLALIGVPVLGFAIWTAASLNYTRVFVERGGFVYYGYQSKPLVTNRARMNLVASNALLAQLGVAGHDPALPVLPTSGSYVGNWDLRSTGSAVAVNNGVTLFVNANGSSTCQDKTNYSFYACTLTITNAASGTFTLADSVGSAEGTFAFMAGTASGNSHDPTSTPVDGTFVGGFYSRSTREGCDAKIENHDPAYADYSLGTRCCL